MNIFKKFPRSFATILVAILTIVTGGVTDFGMGESFFTDILSGAGAPVAMGLSLLLMWVGDRFLSVPLTPTLITGLTLLGSIIAFFITGELGEDLQTLIQNFVSNQGIMLGAISAFLTKIFGDRNIDIYADKEQLGVD